MSALVRKELRSILPPWLLAMALAILPIWLAWPGELGIYAGTPGYLVYAPFALGVLLLSLTPFGQELNWGTFSVLLAQPVSRARIWRVKTLILAVALLLVFAALFISARLRLESVIEGAKNTFWRGLLSRPGGDPSVEMMISDTRRSVLLDLLEIGGLGALAGFAGGLWTTLLFRQVSAAFWFTLLVPTGLGLLTSQLLGGFSDTVAFQGTCDVLGVYSVLGLLWARHLFQEVQDTQWTGGVVSLPAWRGRAAGGRKGATRRERRALSALLKKEFESQYVNLLLAGGLALLHLAVLVVRGLSAGYLETHRTLAMTLETVPILWLVMPLLVGSVAVAEERKLGTFESLSCVPVSRRWQFGLKFVVALGLGFLLGAVAPLGIEWLGTRFGLRPNMSFTGAGGLWTFSGAAGAITFLAFYGSSLTRNTLQALASGIFLCVVAALVGIAGSQPPSLGGVLVWRPELLALVLGPVMALGLLVLACRNYRQVQVRTRDWRRNAWVVLVLLLSATAATSAIYHRFWEAWQPLEPPHAYVESRGPREFATLPKVAASFHQMAVLLPDGRLWMRGQRVEQKKVVVATGPYFLPEAKGPFHTGFAPGKNWRDIATSALGCVAIQQDGSLWDLSHFQPGVRGSAAEFKRLGDGNDWSQVAAGWEHFCALKSDGTLWEWGYRLVPPASNTAQMQLLSLPTQVGTDTDWVAIANSDEGSVAAKADGTIWRWGAFAAWGHHNLTNEDSLLRPRKWLAFPGAQRPVSLSYNGLAVAAVCDDGSLWVGGNVFYQMLGPRGKERGKTEMVRWGSASNWTQFQFVGPLTAAGVKRDGSLWVWDAGAFRYASLEWHPPQPLSDYAVWLAVGETGSHEILSLGRDGTLCRWANPEAGRDDFYPERLQRLLMPSRIHAREIADLGR